jgi:adenylate cyclase
MAGSVTSHTSEFADPRFQSAFAWKIWRRSNAGVALAVVAVTLIAVFGAPTYLGEGESALSLVPLLLVIIPPFWLASVSLGFATVRYIVRRSFRWASEGRTPSSGEINLLAAGPRIAGAFCFVTWTVSVPILLIIANRYVDIRWEGGLWQSLAMILGFGGLAASVASYLFTEQAVRPVLSRILPADPALWPRTVGLSARLVTLSAIVAGGPLLVIAFVIASYSEEQRRLAGPGLIAACLLFSSLGIVVFRVAGQAITTPLERLRTKMGAVTAGDLGSDVETVEASEIGQLQLGFNQMLDGLRERERMRDVFGRHVGTDVAKRAMETGFESSGEVCDATALFVDIIGSTGLTQRSEPDAVVSILNRFFDTVVRVVGAEGGFVNKFQGDGALCLFGTPVAQADHAARGLRAARNLARELAPMGDIAAAIGVSSGPVVAGDVGAEDRYEFTVIGDAVNEASRLSDEAKLHPSHVLVSERTIQAARNEAQGWIRGEAIALRGRSQPTITYSPYD